MSDVEQSPEFQEALKKACDEELNSWLFGDRRKAKAAEKLPPSVQEAMKEAGKIKRQAESMRHRAESQMLGGFGMFPSPMLPSLPENSSREDLDRYRTEMDAYSERVRSQAQMMSDPMIQRGMERFANPSQGLHCSNCGDSDHGNKMNGVPWCMKCNCALESPSKKSGKKQMRIKRAEKKVPNILRGLP